MDDVSYYRQMIPTIFCVPIPTIALSAMCFRVAIIFVLIKQLASDMMLTIEMTKTVMMVIMLSERTGKSGRGVGKEVVGGGMEGDAEAALCMIAMAKSGNRHMDTWACESMVWSL